ncbi:MAG: hypothetical protein ACR2P0_19595 [Acidimicrobiales bacterium]
MTGVARYTGRLGGAGVADDLPGPATVATLFESDLVVVADPLSFPWQFLDPDTATPMVVDLRACSEDDLVALRVVLPVLTPADRLVVNNAARTIARELHLPDEMMLDDLPDDGELETLARASPKLFESLLREGLVPILEREIEHAGGGQRPVRLAEINAPNEWTRALVDPHPVEMVDASSDLRGAAYDIVLVHVAGSRSVAVDRLIGCLDATGLIVMILDSDATTRSGDITMASIMAEVHASLGQSYLFEHVWGLHPRPGRPPVGGIVAIRPLAGTAPDRP